MDYLKKIKDPEKMLYIFIASAIIAGILHQNNFFAPIHEYHHFVHWESAGQNPVWTKWSQITVMRGRYDAKGLTRGFFGEASTYSVFFFVAAITTANPVFTPIFTGVCLGAFISAWEYGLRSSDFERISKILTSQPPNFVYDAYNRHCRIHSGLILIGLLIFIKRRTYLFD